MLKALAIDDEVTITTILSRFLDGAGFETEVASSGPEGLEKAMIMRPDVTIVDIMMPDVDGYEVCRRLRKDPRTARGTIVTLTARGQMIDKQMAFEAGANAHITKPFKGKELVDEIQRLLSARVCVGPPMGHHITVLRLEEKVGATMLATNLALALAKGSGCQVAIADLVLEGGAVLERLGLTGTNEWPISSQTSAYELATYLTRHESGLFVLPAPKPSGGGQVPPAAVSRMLDTLSGWNDFALYDTPVNLGLLAAPLMRSSDLILLVLKPSQAIIRQAKQSLKVLVQSGVRQSQIWPVLNMVRPEQDSWQKEIENLWGIPLPAALPWAPMECGRAMTQHQSLILNQPDSPIAEVIHHLAHKITQDAGSQIPKEANP
jgi:pilus assembly protein CpaE